MTEPAPDFASLRAAAGIGVEELAGELGYSPSTIYRWERGETKPRTAAVRALETMALFRPEEPQDAAFRFIDLFAGIGELRRGFEAIDGQCVFTSEWDRYSRKSYLANFHCDHEVAGDITHIEAEHIPEHDVLLARRFAPAA